MADKQMDRPLQGEHASHRGRYEPAIIIRRPVLDPGEIVHVEVFITGYGTIDGAKLNFLPSREVFDISKSRVKYDLKKEGDLITWGGSDAAVDEIGKTIGLTNGLQKPGWKKSTLFFDAHPVTDNEVPQISTETRHGVGEAGAPPVLFTLRTRPDVKPGIYNLQFSFTYFDGHDWQLSSQEKSFTVRSLIQRNELLIAVIALIAAVVAIAPTLFDFVKFLLDP